MNTFTAYCHQSHRDIEIKAKGAMPKEGDLVTVKLDNRGCKFTARCGGYIRETKRKTPEIVLCVENHGPQFHRINKIISFEV